MIGLPSEADVPCASSRCLWSAQNVSGAIWLLVATSPAGYRSKHDESACNLKFLVDLMMKQVEDERQGALSVAGSKQIWLAEREQQGSSAEHVGQ